MLQAAAAERERLSMEAAQSRLLCKARARQVADLETKLNEQVSCNLCGGPIQAIVICMLVLVVALHSAGAQERQEWQQRWLFFRALAHEVGRTACLQQPSL